MKSSTGSKIALIALALVTAATAGVAAAPRAAGSGDASPGSTSHMLDAIEPAPLSQAEEESIIFMREEEKLARDVYLALYDLWQINVFGNIARSEQQHMDAMLSLVERYDLADPALTPGQFSDPELQALYDTLIERGSESAEEALRVGALIEEVDIEDLARDVELADNEDIALIYGNLLAASENHLRAFAGQIERFYGEYEPVVLSEDHYESIMESRTSGPAEGRGAPADRGRAPRGRAPLGRRG